MSRSGEIRDLRAARHWALRFAIVLLFFPLTYYFSHPETYYFRPVDPLIVVPAALFIAGRSRHEKPPPASTRVEAAP
jgi:hypothetical protein